MKILYFPVLMALASGCYHNNYESLPALGKLGNVLKTNDVEEGEPLVGAFYPLRIEELHGLTVSSVVEESGDTIMVFYLSSKNPVQKPFVAIGVGARKSAGNDHMALRGSFLEVATSNPNSNSDVAVRYNDYYVTKVLYIEE